MQLSKNALMLLGVDLALVLLAGWASFWLRFNFDIPPEFDRLALLASPWCVVGYAVGLTLARVYRQVWSYIGLAELRQLATGIIFGGVLTAAMVLMLRMPAFPRSVLLLQPLIALVLLGAARAGWRTFTERRTLGQGGRRLVIVGTLQDASDALRALKGSQQWQPVGIVSPAGAEVGRSIQNVRVLGQTSGMTEICEAAQADAALIASPAGSSERHEALMSAAGSRLTLLTMPRPDEWLKTDSPGPRKIELEDLLGRTAVQLDAAGLAELFSGQTVLVTGAGGSIGSELCRQVARFGVGRLVCVDVSELAIYQLEQELREAHPQMHGCYYTANVREAQRLQAIALKHRPAVVLHAAANKHVPLMEELNEIEALRTNVLGTLHAARAAGESGARRFVMISTDKAVNPTNVMGASKRLAELMVQGAASEYPGTQFVSVPLRQCAGLQRFGGAPVHRPDRAWRPRDRHPSGHRALFHDHSGGGAAGAAGGADGQLGPDLRARHGGAGQDCRTRPHADPAVRQDRTGNSDQLPGTAPRRKTVRRAARRRRDDRTHAAPQAAGRQDFERRARHRCRDALDRRGWPGAGRGLPASVAANPGARVRAEVTVSGGDAAAGQDVADQFEAHQRVVQFHQPLLQLHRNRQQFAPAVRDPAAIVQPPGPLQRHLAG